jgi:hypothetical protein
MDGRLEYKLKYLDWINLVQDTSGYCSLGGICVWSIVIMFFYDSSLISAYEFSCVFLSRQEMRSPSHLWLLIQLKPKKKYYSW